MMDTDHHADVRTIMPHMHESTYGLDTERILDRTRRGITMHVSRGFAERIALDTAEDHLGERLAMSLTAEVLTEHLPPHTITHHVRYEHPGAIGQPGTAVDSRFERPIDHFTAKYRGRWWGRLLGLRQREVRYEFVAVPYLVSKPVQCDHLVTVDVRASWTYPKPNRVLPAADWGPTVLDARDVRSESYATYREQQGDALGDAVKAHARLRGDRW